MPNKENQYEEIEQFQRVLNKQYLIESAQANHNRAIAELRTQNTGITGTGFFEVLLMSHFILACTSVIFKMFTDGFGSGSVTRRQKRIKKTGDGRFLNDLSLPSHVKPKYLERGK